MPKRKFELIGLFLLTALFSCTDHDLIGLEVQAESDKVFVNTTDYNFFDLKSEEEDSLRSDERARSLVGQLNDPVFGHVSASFSTQLTLSESAVDFGESPVLDKAEISFVYEGYYGDTTQEVTLNVYEVEEDIYLDSVYYSSDVLAANSLLKSHSFYPHPQTVIDEEGTKALVFRMDELGQRILDASSDDLKDDASFTAYFKGIQLRMEDPASVLYFNLKSNQTKLTLYYNGTDTFNLWMGSSSARVNHFDVSQDLDTMTYYGVQSMGGYNLGFEFTDLEALKNQLADKPINQALLTFKIDEGSEADFASHQELSLVRVDSTGKKFFLTDFFEGQEHAGGAKEDGMYTFNISRYLGKLISGEMPSEKLLLMPVGSTINANRTLISPEVELKITYTEF